MANGIRVHFENSLITISRKLNLNLKSLLLYYPIELSCFRLVDVGSDLLKYPAYPVLPQRKKKKKKTSCPHLKKMVINGEREIKKPKNKKKNPD